MDTPGPPIRMLHTVATPPPGFTQPSTTITSPASPSSPTCSHYSFATPPQSGFSRPPSSGFSQPSFPVFTANGRQYSTPNAHYTTATAPPKFPQHVPQGSVGSIQRVVTMPTSPPPIQTVPVSRFSHPATSGALSKSHPPPPPKETVATPNSPQAHKLVTAPAQTVVPSAQQSASSPTNQGPPIYNYKFHDAGNNQMTPSDPSLPTFSVQTDRGRSMDMAQRSVVTCTFPGEKARKMQGEIDWKGKRISVGNVNKSLSEAKRKVGGTLSLDTEWTWPSGKYTITYKSRTWTVKRGGQGLAVYTSLKVNAFSKNELATLRFLVNMPYEEQIFLILALMFHDLQMPPVAEPKTFKQGAGEAGVNVATTVAANVATNAIANCCAVQ